MQALARSKAELAAGFRRWTVVSAVVLLALMGAPRAQAGATLLLEEPYSYDGAFAGTGHTAIYLSHVCADSPVHLRACAAGETGVVLSRYDGIDDYDWIAVPLVPYLYAVDRAEDVPLFADAKVVAFLRDRYRRDHLTALAPDRADGGTPEGNWYELIGSAYDRTIYGFEIETSAAQDARLIDKFNLGPNRQRYNVVKRNCADFVREVVNFYYPHALHRSIIGDLGVTTPKQIAKMMMNYSRKHPELQSLNYLVPQVPGAIRRSKPIHGVLDSVVAAKKYMVPLVIVHPYIAGGLLAGYFGHLRFDPAQKCLVSDGQGHLDPLMSRDQRTAYQSRLDELSVALGTVDSGNEGKAKELKSWEHMQAGAQPMMDASGRPALQFGVGDDAASVGLARANIGRPADSRAFASRLMEARLREELRPANARKTSPREVERDLLLFQKLSRGSRAAAGAPAEPTARVPVRGSFQVNQ
jgi:hypothetical protein